MEIPSPARPRPLCLTAGPNNLSHKLRVQTQRKLPARSRGSEASLLDHLWSLVMESRFRERITRVTTQVIIEGLSSPKHLTLSVLLSLTSDRRPTYESGIQFAFSVVDRYPNRNLSPRSQFSSGF